MHHDDREAEDDRHLRQQEERLDALVVRTVAERAGDQIGRERRLRPSPREVAGVVLRAAIEQQRHDDERDHAENDPRRARVRSVEPGRSVATSRRLAQPHDRERGQREQHGDREEVLEQAEPAGMAEEREREVLADHKRAVCLDDGREEDYEAPEREEVREARRRPAQQPALPEDLDELGAQPLADPVPASRRLSPGADQLDQPGDAAAGDRRRQHEHEQGDGEAQRHDLSPRSGRIASA